MSNFSCYWTLVIVIKAVIEIVTKIVIVILGIVIVISALVIVITSVTLILYFRPVVRFHWLLDHNCFLSANTLAFTFQVKI